MLSFFRLSFIFFVFLTSLYPTFPLKSDQVHIPSYVFEDHPSGQKALNPARATNASLVHLDGIKGRTKAGKRLLAAVIDSSINTALPHMKELREKGLFHPAALEPNNPYMVNPNEAEEFDKYDKLVKDLQDKKWKLIFKFDWTPEEKKKTKDEIQKIGPLLHEYEKKRIDLLDKKLWFDAYNKKEGSNHGSGVIHALHTIAPEASILPIDLAIMQSERNGKKLTPSDALTLAIRTAINHKADVINLSRSLQDLDRNGFKAMVDAVRKGITVVISAGNDTNSRLLYYVSYFYDEIKKIFVKSKEQELFEKLKGYGIIFAGATAVDPLGKEKVSEYSQHPEKDSKRNFLLAPGDYLNIQANSNPHKLVRGTSFSAPVIAGSILLLEQYCLDKGYKTTPEDIKNILYDSGHDIIYPRNWPFDNETYKSVDLCKARKFVDEKFKPKPPAPVAKKPLVVKKPVAKPLAQKPPAKAAPKKPLAKKPPVKGVSKKPLAQKPPVKAAPKKPLAKKRIARKPAVKAAPRKPISRKPVVKKSSKKVAHKKTKVQRKSVKRPVAKKKAARRK